MYETMAIAILDSQFTILNLHNASATCQTYRGSDSCGRSVFIKVLNRHQQFFDEMARYLATDRNDSLPYLQANYPPVSYGGEDVLTGTSFGEAIEFHAARASDNSPSPTPTWDLSDLGILVTEWIEGESVASSWPEWSSDQKLRFTRNLTQSLATLHANGEYHGNLQWRHVLIEKCTGHVKLVGLGHYPGKPTKDYDSPAPEHLQIKGLTVGQATDVYLLAKLFLARLDNVSDHPFLESCLDPNPQRRPTISQVARFVEGLGAHYPFYSSPIGLGMYCLSAIILGLLALAFSSNQKATIATTSSIFHTPKASSLAQLLEETRKDLSESDQSQLMHGIRFLDEYDLRRPIAVLVFQRQVFLIGRDLTFAEGDRVYFRGSNYFISQLSPRHIQLTQNDQHVSIFFEPHDKAKTTHSSDTGVFVWDNPNNVVRFLQGIAEVSPILHPQQNFPLSPLFEVMAKLGDYKVEGFDGNIQGNFADGNFCRFLGHLDRLIQYKVDANTVTLSATSPHIQL